MKNNPTNITSSGASKKLVPEFRFPEFVNDDEWVSTSLGNKCIYVSSGKNKEKKEKGEFPVYGSTGVIGYSGSFVYDFPAILVARVGANAGQINKVTGKYDVTDNTIIIQLNDNCNLDYVYYFLASRNINIFVFGSGQPLITSSLLKKLILSLPSLSEQKRIAQCLSSLDERIAATKEKVELLKEHKRGLMQKLFPAKGKTLPELRFPEFINEEEWKETSIEEQCPVRISGGTPNTSMTQYYGGDIPFIRSAEIASNKTELTLTQAGIENSSAKIVSKGDILIALYGANSGDVAIAKISGAINQAILCLRPICVNGYLYHFLSQNKSNIIDKYLQGGQGNLSGEIIRSIKFPLPPSKEEQQKISFVLSSIDDMIEQYDEKVKVLKLHKKGLMQKLFPNNI